MASNRYAVRPIKVLAAAVKHVYDHPTAGPLRFRLGFEPVGGASAHIEVTAPDGKRLTTRPDPRPSEAACARMACA